MILKKLSITADLSEASLAAGKSECYCKIGDDVELTVSTALMETANRLCRGTDMKVFVDTNLPENGWYVTTKYFGVYSPGT
mgnify:CR=1 FL=1